MKTIYLNISCCLLCFFGGREVLSQHKSQVIDLMTTHVTENVDDLKKLDSIFSQVRLIGMGESTHGTHEFFAMRHRLFKYLVEFHGFNTFFMETEVTDSFVIDDYINGGDVTRDEIIKSLQFWPWQTEEVVQMLGWMREFNARNPDKAIQFVGVDQQYFESARKGLITMLNKNNIKMPIEEISEAENWKFLRFQSKDLKQYSSFIASMDQFDISFLSENEAFRFKIMLNHCRRALEGRTTKEPTFRDRMMASEIIAHLEKDPKAKGFFWGHNGHIANFYSEKRSTGVAGGYLKRKLGTDYFSIGQDFDKGTFNAYYKVKDSKLLFPDGYELGVVTTERAANKSFASNFRTQNTGIIFIPFKYLPETESVTITRIGVTSPKVVEPTSILRFNHHGRTSFDAMILFRISSPTRLIRAMGIDRLPLNSARLSIKLVKGTLWCYLIQIKLFINNSLPLAQ